jgi:hypothetical protein
VDLIDGDIRGEFKSTELCEGISDSDEKYSEHPHTNAAIRPVALAVGKKAIIFVSGSFCARVLM